MKLIRSFALNFYLPLLVSFSLLFVVLVSPKIVGTNPKPEIKANSQSGVNAEHKLEYNIEVSVLGIRIPLPIWLEKVWILRGLLLLTSLLCLIRALTLDFSKYFPKKLHMDVYFDRKGLERNLKNFTAKELFEVSLVKDWEKHVSTYDEAAVLSLGSLWKRRDPAEVPNIQDFARELLHARGSTSFIVERVGPLSYRIKESLGHLEYDWDVPKKPRRTFSTQFQLHETVSNHIRPNLWDLLKSSSIIMKPEFKQVFSIEAGQHAPFDHIVIGFTKVFLLPFPRFTNTVYLWKLSDVTTVPVAYTIYYPEIAHEI